MDNCPSSHFHELNHHINYPPIHSAHHHDDFLLALQEAAVSCLELFQPSESAASRSLHFAQPICSDSRISQNISPQIEVPQPKSSSWLQDFDDCTFPFVDFAACEGFSYPDSLDERMINDNCEISSNHAETSPCVDLHSLESLDSSADIDDSWLDSLPLISDLGATNVSSASLDSMYSTSSFSISSHENDEVCAEVGTPETFLVTKAQSAADGICHSGSPVSRERSGVSKFFASTDRSIRKRRRRSDPAEPRYMLVTRSNEDVLDDGFKWRKYGQKHVKNGSYPRSYYKCFYSRGCHAQKHVQRSSLDHSFVLTTYQGRHSHECP